MGKKAKCYECNNSMCFAVPSAKFLSENKFTYDTVKNYISCEHTMKTKHKNHEQQCKHYIPETEFHKMGMAAHENTLKAIEDQMVNK